VAAEAELESAILLRTPDAMRARLVRALLEEEGIAVATPGLEHHSLMPHVGSAIEIIVRVPRAELARARALVDEMEREVEEEPVPAESAPYRETAKAKPAPLAPRLKRVAVVAACIVPGGAHFYVQRYALAAVVIAGYAAVIAAIALAVPAAAFLLPLVWLGDVVGGLEGCDEARDPKSGARWRRFAAPGVLAATAAWAGVALGPLLPTLAGEDARTTCDFERRCAGADDEHACLLRGANDRLDGRVVSPDCAACLRAHPGCDDASARCDVCWPEAPSPLLLGY
jgi:hypothetical protein